MPHSNTPILQHPKVFTTALLVLAIGIGLVNVFLMPPFMNPDEIQHFMFSASYAYNEEELKELDRNVLQLLKDYKWFHFIGVGPGWESIKKIEDIYFLNYFSRGKKYINKTYFHFIYGKILEFTGIKVKMKDTLTAFYLFRLISFFIYLVIFLLSLFFYRKYFPGNWIYLITGQLVIFQLATILNALNYDVLLTLFGVLFFIFSYRFLISDEKKNLIFLIVLSALASLIKTAGFLFFIYFFILLLFKYRIKLKFLKTLFLSLFLFIIIFCWFNYWFPERFFTLYNIIFSKLRILTGPAAVTGGAAANLDFFNSILDSFYFHTGWMAFKLNDLWYLILKVFLFFSIIGAVVGIGVKKLNTVSIEKKWLIYALLISVMQMGAIRIYYGSVQMAQGRYLYPLIIPIIILIYCGLNYIEKCFSFKRNYLVIFFIVFQVIFLLFAFTRIISVFYLEIPSPHPGL
jgi:hypothetical protein